MPNYKTIFNNLPVPALRLSHDGAILESNHYAKSIFSDLEEPQSMSEKIQFWLGDAIAEFINGVDGCATLERSLKQAGRRPSHFNINLSKLEGAGRLPDVMAVCTDITDRYKYQEKIRRQTAIIDSSNDAMVSMSINGTIFSANRSAACLYGYDADELVGGSIFDLTPSRLEEEMHSVFKEVREGCRVVRLETMRHSRYGPEFPVSDTYSPIIINGKAYAVSLVTRDISERKEAELALSNSHTKLKSILVETVNALSMTLEKRDLYTAGHQQKVAIISCAIGRQMGLDSDELDAIHTAGVLHDIGKICIPMAILSKPAKLSSGEMGMVRCHPQNGLDIIKDIPFPRSVGAMIHQHHERIDGTGYPEGLSGGDICLGARIIAVADVLEAMGSHRPYRPALGIGAALEEFKAHTGQKYDSNVCDALLALVDRGDIITQKGELILCR
ncbi:MAG: PAS domain S-box protein [Pseudodesulfovibrio sp.]|nr:PAS domain S-box protein [Pseudodesulfovibrio sp.]